MVRNFRARAAWIPGVIAQQLGPVTYLVNVSEGRHWKRHVDHIKNLQARPTENEFQHQSPPEVETTETVEPEPVGPGESVTPDVATGTSPEPSGTVTSGESETNLAEPPPEGNVPSQGATPTPPTQKQYPTRSRKPPDWYHHQVWWGGM